MTIKHRMTITIFSLITASCCLFQACAAQPSTEEMLLRDAWVRQHFPANSTGPRVSIAPAIQTPAKLMAWTSYGPVFCNTIPGKMMQIADRKFEHGLFCHAPARIQVFLPGPAKWFSAVAGILTNPDSHGGSVIFSVDLEERRLFSSAVIRRGEGGVPIKIDLDGARSFIISANCAGDGLAGDQGVWGDAKVTLTDGKEIFISDLPLHDPLACERSADTPPFSFTYGNQHSDRLLPAWAFKEERDTSKPGKAIRMRAYTDPKTGLIVRNTIVEYANFPTVEWTLSFKNSGASDTPILEGILPLDSRFNRGESGEFLLHHFIGSPCQANDYEPLETKLEPKTTHEMLGRELLETGLRVTAARPQTALNFTYRRQL